MNRPKPFNTQHNIRVYEKEFGHKNLTVARKARKYFIAFLFLAIVNYFLPYYRQAIPI